MSAPWHDEARRLKADGKPTREIARLVGRSQTVLIDFFNPASAQRRRLRKIERRAEARLSYNGERKRAFIEPEVLDAAVVASYGDKPSRHVPSLPKISLQAVVDEPKPLRIVTRTVFTDDAGADRWREVHRKMIREGRISQPGLVEEMRH